LLLWQTAVVTETDDVIAAAGPRLKMLRTERRLTLAEVEERTGISKSTLSRLEAGSRRATLELLVPLARTYRVTLDELVEAPTPDPRVRSRPVTRDGRTMLPLTHHASGGIQAYKILIPAGGATRPEPRVHEGYEWLYVLGGRLRLVLGDHDIVLEPGEAAEFDTRTPHWFGPESGGTVELLSLFGLQGERVHVRASTTPKPR
jgi:transcriptional regulator with XRE-family HTH domain